MSMASLIQSIPQRTLLSFTITISRLVRIYKADYEKLLVPILNKLFPVLDPDPNGFGLQEYFDTTSVNYFGKDDWKRLIEALTNSKIINNDEDEFMRVLIDNMIKFMKISDVYCIEGNL